jgi:hypothetical protein
LRSAGTQYSKHCDKFNDQAARDGRGRRDFVAFGEFFNVFLSNLPAISSPYLNTNLNTYLL